MMRVPMFAAAVVLASAVAWAQPAATLRVTVTLPDSGGTLVPVARHALLISDNPPTREPRRLVTSADGTLTVTLAPGSYIVESDQAVAFGGTGYRWTAIVDVTAGKETVLQFTAQNADVVPLAEAAPKGNTTIPAPDIGDALAKWQASVVTIWSPIAKASGFVVDASGLLVTDRSRIGKATSVEVQVSRTTKVPAEVLFAEATRDVAIVRVDPSVLAQSPPVPLECPSARAAGGKVGDEIVALAASIDGGNQQRGEITGFHPRGIETDLRLAFGDSGGAVFSADGASVVGLMFAAGDENTRGGDDVLVARAGVICETIAAARSRLAGQPPSPVRLPLEPERAYPVETLATSPTPAATGPPTVASEDFDIAFITPRAVLDARQVADRTGRRTTRSPEAEAVLGRLTDFGPLTDYFSDNPAVLIVRVTPKMVEGFWKRLAREAARTQGAVLPAFKDFKTNFVRLRATCGGTEVTPIHPFVLEHEIGEKRIIREGLYVFGPDAFGPHCGGVTLTVSPEQTPSKPDTITIDAKVIDQIAQDFAPFKR